MTSCHGHNETVGLCRLPFIKHFPLNQRTEGQRGHIGGICHGGQESPTQGLARLSPLGAGLASCPALCKADASLPHVRAQVRVSLDVSAAGHGPEVCPEGGPR